MNSFLRHLPLFILLTCISNLQAQNEQDWLTVGENNPNFNDMKAAFFKGNAERIKQYHQDMANLASGKIKEIPKGTYTNLKQFMRLLDWYEPRVAESKGDLRVVGEATDRALFQAIEAKKNLQTRGAQWKLLGPINQSSSLSGNGRINSIRIDPTNPDILYACSPAAQLFKSENGGGSWRSISDGIPTTGVSDVAIDSTAPNTLYAITGDADRASFQPASTGLYKSTDGGGTWTQTSLAYTQANGIVLTTVVLNPKDPNIVLVAGTNGIFRSIDKGATFVRTSTQSTRELVFKPHNPNILFAGSKTGGILMRSNDNGLSWERLTNGLPTTDVSRFSIAISPINPNYVYVLATNAANGMRGFYRSTDGGTNFTVMSTAPNIPGTQGWYDLAIAADPTNADIVYAGGISTYKSTNGGATWVTTGSGAIHVDVHCMTFSGNTLFNANDGGVYKTSNQGSTWSNISSNLSIAQLYSLGNSATDENLILSGHQDNGTNLTTNNIGWRQVSGGDGLVSFIDRTNDSVMYCQVQYGVLRRSLNKGASFTTIYTVPNSYWLAPFIQDPQIPTTLYAGGGEQVLKSINRGTTWVAISNFSGASVRWLDVDRNDNKIIYALATNKLYKTVDGGLNWADISTGLPTSGLLHVHIDVNNSKKLYISVGSYTGASMYFSNNGGTTWTNFASGLPRVPAITVTTQLGAPGELYCGTDIGVYYRDSTSTTWEAFQTGMPNVPVRDLEIFYPTGKLRAATYGRSIWESPLVNFTKKCEAISPPSVFDVSITTASVSWSTALGANRYDVEYKKADSSNWISLKNINNTTVNLTGLSSGSVYEVRVKSVCADVTQAPISEVKSFTPTCTAPPPPSVSNIKTTEADVIWSLINGVSNYKLEYKIADSTKWTAVKGILDFGYTLTGLNKGTNYSVRLSNNCTAADSSLPSLQKDFTTLCPSTQMMVSKIKATEALISWRPISGIASYKLEYKVAENTIWKGVSELKDTFYTLKDLVIGTTYDVRILTYCTSAISPPSLSERFLTSTTPVSNVVSAEKLELNLFPNPAHNNVNLDLHVPKYGVYEIGFYTILGTKILNQKIGLREGKHAINISTEGFTKGVYYVQVVLGDARVVKKLLIY